MQTMSPYLSASASSYAHGADSVPLLGQTIGENLRSAVVNHGDREALVVRNQNYRATYRQLWDATTRAARALMACDVGVGDRVGVWSPNRYEWVVAQFATARVGAILVNVNPAYRAPELEYALRLSGVSVLLLAPRFRQTDYVGMLETVRPRCPELLHTIVFGENWEGWLDFGERTPELELAKRESSLQFDDPINIQYTSGTTGFPKGATLTHHNLLNNGYFVGRCLGYTEQDRVCIPVPFYHCFGMVLGNLACVAHGACMVVPDESFVPCSVLETVQGEGCTSLYGVPTMFRAVLEVNGFDGFDCSSLRTGIMAGAPCPIELMREVIDRLHLPEIAIGYGMTETSPISTMSARDDALSRRVGTVGRVQPHIEICVRDPVTHAIVPRRTAGELCTRGYSVMRGYWRDETATRAAIDCAGWMHSGDLAVMDEAGYVHIVGRIKDVIIRGGEKIPPVEVEAVLLANPDVSEAQVIGIPSRKYGEEIMAWIRARPGVVLEESCLAEFCRQRLSTYKVPSHWRFVDQFPTTVTGKVQKFKLREMAIEMLGLHDEAASKTA
jgi:fatty-acyl-CoA synthase